MAPGSCPCCCNCQKFAQKTQRTSGQRPRGQTSGAHHDTKLIQEAVVSRDTLREELVDVYLRVRRLPKEEWPLPKETPKIPT
eukprot:5499681-Amphidinium_carterae.1